MAKDKNAEKLMRHMMKGFIEKNPDEMRKTLKLKNEMEKFKKAAKGRKPKTVTAVAKKTLGKAIARKLPVVGAALIARDVVKALSPSVCRSRGGKWVSGKCVEKKRKVKLTGAANRPVRDPISKR